MDTNLKGTWKNLLALAAGFGLITGLVEGVEFLLLYKAHFLMWRLYNRAIWYETLWIAPLVDLGLFLLIGIFFVLTSLVAPKISFRKPAWFVFILLCVFDWIFILAYGRISIFAILVLVVGLCIQIFNYVIKFETAGMKIIYRMLPWLAGLVFTLFIVVQGGSWLTEVIKTANLP